MEKPVGKKSNVVIFCSDPRVVYWLNQEDFKTKLGIEEGYSAIAETGSIKFFTNENMMDKLYKELDILTHHFSPEKIIITNHTDCGYYKSLNQDNVEAYTDDLKAAKEEISQKYPSVKIEAYLINTETGELTEI